MQTNPSNPVHQIAYLTPKRAVAWKCLSLQAAEESPSKRFAPVAYASLSKHFFPGKENEELPGTLWVVSSPEYKHRNIPEQVFPPALTAKIAVQRIVNGEEIMSWAQDPNDCLLEAPSKDQQFQSWRQALSVPGLARRAAFRISRDFAMLAWMRRHQMVHCCRTQQEAWGKVRTALADKGNSSFIEHVDITDCIGKALALPVGFEKVGRWLQSPRKLHDGTIIEELEKLSVAGTHQTIFLNHRWNHKTAVVAEIAKELLSLKCGIWLDGLAIPHYKAHPSWRMRGRVRRKDPPSVDLGQLLLSGIENSALFLCLAAEDYKDPPKHDPEGQNWAMKEYKHSITHARRNGKPEIKVVNLGKAPEDIVRSHRDILTFRGSSREIATEIASFVKGI